MAGSALMFMPRSLRLRGSVKKKTSELSVRTRLMTGTEGLTLPLWPAQRIGYGPGWVKYRKVQYRVNWATGPRLTTSTNRSGVPSVAGSALMVMPRC